MENCAWTGWPIDSTGVVTGVGAVIDIDQCIATWPASIQNGSNVSSDAARTITVSNTIFNGNWATDDYLIDATPTGGDVSGGLPTTLELSHCTLFGETAQGLVLVGENGGDVTLDYSIFECSETGGGIPVSFTGTIAGTTNIFWDGTGGGTGYTAPADTVVGDPLLGADGRIPALKAFSVALGRAFTSAAVEDYEGNPRPLGNPYNDVGAHESAVVSNIDSDGDGMPDNWEAVYGLDMTSDDTDDDPDLDGYTNLEEYLNGTNPVVATPRITVHPVSQSVNIGASVLLTVEATGTGLYYQWQKNYIDLVGQTSSVLGIASFEEIDSGEYRCAVTNTGGRVYSDVAELTVNELLDVAYDFGRTLWQLGYEPGIENADFNGVAAGLPNGYLDCAEFLLLEAIVNNPTVDLSGSGGLTYEEIRGAWEHNLTVITDYLWDNGLPVPYLFTTAAAYVTTGTSGFNYLNYLVQYLGKPALDPADFVLLAGDTWLAPGQDADGDGLTNGDEYTVALYQNLGAGVEVVGAAFAARALNPELRYPVDGEVVFVDADATGVNDGSSWADAYTNLQDGVDSAFDEVVTNTPVLRAEVWVADGVYVDARDPVVSLRSSVHVYGGFSATEVTREQRDWVSYTAAIDGEGVRRCVMGADDATLDGFTVQNGAATDGAGMLNTSASPTVTNCVFKNNAATGTGGAMYNTSLSAPVLINCLIVSNSADTGAGISNDGQSSPTIMNATVAENTAGLSGGGLYSADVESAPVVTNSILWDNWPEEIVGDRPR